MSRWEKYAFDTFLRWLRPQLAIEVGTFRGGSLQILASHSTKVVSLDISDEPKRALFDKFSNVSFQVGDSRKLLPELIQSVNEGKDVLQFVLIDGDHSTEGVRADIESVLEVKPRAEIYVFMHDSFHPPCREGMLSAAWSGCPFVHYLELDFVPECTFGKAMRMWPLVPCMEALPSQNFSRKRDGENSKLNRFTWTLRGMFT